MSAKYVKDGVEFNCKIFFTFRAFSDHLLAVLAVLYQIIHIYPLCSIVPYLLRHSFLQ